MLITHEEINLSWWDGLATDNVSWGDIGGEYYKRREDHFSYLVVFEYMGVILKAISTMAHPLTGIKPSS